MRSTRFAVPILNRFQLLIKNMQYDQGRIENVGMRKIGLEKNIKNQRTSALLLSILPRLENGINLFREIRTVQ